MKMMTGGLIAILFAGAANATTLTCQVPGFLNFGLQTSAPAASVLSVHQYAYGLRSGPATNLARSLGLLLAPQGGVQSLIVDQKTGNALFTFTDGTTKETNLGALELSTSDGWDRQNGATFQSKTVHLTSGPTNWLVIESQATLCEIGTNAAASTN